MCIRDRENIDEQTEGIRKVLQLHDSEINPISINDPSLRVDFNTPEEYQSAVLEDHFYTN